MIKDRSSGLGLLVLALSGLALGGCAVSPEEDPMFIRLNDLDQRVQRIERVLTNNSLLELAQRLDSMQADVRSLRGEVELLQNQSEGGKAQSRSLYGDLEKRLAALETLGGVGGASPPGAGSALPPAGGVAVAGEQATYDAAFSALKGADYPKAIANFKGFLATYPSSPLASNAQYWLGEAYYVTRSYDDAIVAFRKVSTDWPDSRKAPDALVKVGFTQSALGRNGEARATLEEVTRRFPGSEAAQLATERLKRLPSRAMSADAGEVTPRLKITEIFYSLQGEADSVGYPTVFVRLTGCPLRCQFCDTAYAFHGGEWLGLDAVLSRVAEWSPRHVCVTGGEPLAQKACLPLLSALCDAGYRVSLETSGAMPIAEVDARVIRVVDVKTPGSNEEKRNRYDDLALLRAGEQIKFVICDRADYDWARDKAAGLGLYDRATVLFSPSAEQLPARQLADWILADRLPVRFQLQLHKVLWGNVPGK